MVTQAIRAVVGVLPTPSASRQQHFTTKNAIDVTAAIGGKMTYYVIFNPKSGTALRIGLDQERLARHFEKLGLAAEIDSRDDELEHKIGRAIQSTADTIVCAGGDGTISAVARGLMNSGKSLAILPLGTANLLARDLMIPLDWERAAEVLDRPVIREIDAGEVNGRLFLHKVVVGVIPALAAAREKVRGANLLALFGFVQYCLRRFRDARRTAVAITSRNTVDRVERVHAVAVANNAYDEGWGKVFHRSSLNSGSLTLYVLRRLNLRDALRLAAEMMSGSWQTDAAISIEPVQAVTLRTRRARIAV